MSTHVEVRIKWDESSPGWSAKAFGTKAEARGDEETIEEKVAEVPASSDHSPLLVVANAVDQVCEELNVHPRKVDAIVIRADVAEWLEAARRFTR